MKVIGRAQYFALNFACLALNRHVKVWVQRLGWNRGLVLAYNVSNDNQGLRYAIDNSGVCPDRSDIERIISVVSRTPYFHKVTREAQIGHIRILVAEWEHQLGRTSIEVEVTPCLDAIVVFKQGKGRICKFKVQDFVAILHFMKIEVNTAEEETDEAMDIELIGRVESMDWT